MATKPVTPAEIGYQDGQSAAAAELLRADADLDRIRSTESDPASESAMQAIGADQFFGDLGVGDDEAERAEAEADYNRAWNEAIDDALEVL